MDDNKQIKTNILTIDGVMNAIFLAMFFTTTAGNRAGGYWLQRTREHHDAMPRDENTEREAREAGQSLTCLSVSAWW
jgi:hypothetical protein